MGTQKWSFLLGFIFPVLTAQAVDITKFEEETFAPRTVFGICMRWGLEAGESERAKALRGGLTPEGYCRSRLPSGQLNAWDRVMLPAEMEGEEQATRLRSEFEGSPAALCRFLRAVHDSGIREQRPPESCVVTRMLHDWLEREQANINASCERFLSSLSGHVARFPQCRRPGKRKPALIQKLEAFLAEHGNWIVPTRGAHDIFRVREEFDNDRLRAFLASDESTRAECVAPATRYYRALILQYSGEQEAYFNTAKYFLDYSEGTKNEYLKEYWPRK